MIVPIPGTRKLERLDENIGAVAVELTPDDLRDIESAASRITVQELGTPNIWREGPISEQEIVEMQYLHSGRRSFR